MTAFNLRRVRLDHLIDPKHPLVQLSRRMPWSLIESALASYFPKAVEPAGDAEATALADPRRQKQEGNSVAGQHRLPIRLMVSLLYLQNAYNLSDAELLQRWTENVQWQYFSGQNYYDPRLPCDPGEIKRFRNEIGEAGSHELLRTMIDTELIAKGEADL